MKKKKKLNSVAPVIVTTAVWVGLSFVLPLGSLWGMILTGIAGLGAGLFTNWLVSPAEKAAEPAEQEPQQTGTGSPYSPEVQAILREGALAQQEMGRLYASIDDKNIRQKINQIMMVSDKIAQDAIHDPTDVPQIQKFLSYYLPTTIKLLNAYDRMGSQGIEGENISGTMKNIEEMLDTAIVAYRKQLDSLFANQALDIDTDIQVMNAMLAREGLADDLKSTRPSASSAVPNTGYESPFGDASPLASGGSK